MQGSEGTSPGDPRAVERRVKRSLGEELLSSLALSVLSAQGTADCRGGPLIPDGRAWVGDGFIEKVS